VTGATSHRLEVSHSYTSEHQHQDLHIAKDFTNNFEPAFTEACINIAITKEYPGVPAKSGSTESALHTRLKLLAEDSRHRTSTSLRAAIR